MSLSSLIHLFQRWTKMVPLIRTCWWSGLKKTKKTNNNLHCLKAEPTLTRKLFQMFPLLVLTYSSQSSFWQRPCRGGLWTGLDWTSHCWTLIKESENGSSAPRKHQVPVPTTTGSVFLERGSGSGAHGRWVAEKPSSLRIVAGRRRSPFPGRIMGFHSLVCLSDGQ